MLLLALFVVAVRLWMTREMETPFLFSDEIGYLLDARFLSGVQPSPEHPYVPFYSVGYPILLAPLSWIFKNPIGVYHGALVVNALIGGALIPVLYALGREAIGLSERNAFLAAAVTGVYPGFLLHTNIAWAENLIPLLAALQLLFVYRALYRQQTGWALAVAGTSAALYVTHPRTLAIVGATVAVLLGAALWRAIPRMQVAACLVLMGPLMLAGRLLNEHVRSEVYRGPVGGGPSTTEGSGDFVFRSLEEPSAYDGAIIRGLQQVWYMCTTSLGLWALGMGALVWFVVRNRRPADPEVRSRAWTAGLVFVATLASLVPNALIISEIQPNTFYSFYGRYMESIAPAVLLAGAAVILLLRNRRQRLLAIGGAAVLTISLTVVSHIESPDLEKAGVNPVNTLAVLWPGGVTSWSDLIGFDLFRAMAYGLAGMALFALIPARRAALAVCAAAAIFLAVSAVTSERTIQPFSVALVAAETLQETIPTLPPGEPISYELSSWRDQLFAQYQFLEDDRKFLLYEERDGERPRSQIVIGKVDDERMRAEGARVVAFEGHLNQALWIRPGPLLDRYKREGKVFSPDIGARLPRSARHSRFTIHGESELPLRIPRGTSRRLSFTLTHTGARSPWRQPATVAEAKGGGAVSVAASWLPATGRGNRISAQTAPPPRTLAPGGSLNMALTIVAVDKNGQALLPGRYVVELSPMQEGLGFFVDEGDDPLLIPVEVTG